MAPRDLPSHKWSPTTMKSPVYGIVESLPYQCWSSDRIPLVLLLSNR
jgi:hypothetical protein